MDRVILLTSSPKSQQIEFFEGHSVPVIFASHTDKDSRFASINIDEFQATYDATRFLIQSGHRGIDSWSG